MDRIELPPSSGSLGGSYELTYDGRILTVSTKWKDRQKEASYDTGVARWKLWEGKTGLVKKHRQIFFSIHTPPIAAGGDQLSAEGFEGDVLREFVERVFGAASDLSPSSVLGRATIVDVRSQAAGELVDCTITAKVRLIDGTPPYEATFDATLSQQRADLLHPGRSMVAVRAAVSDHRDLMISWSEAVPVVTVNDPEILERPARALRDGEPCRIVVLDHARQFLRTPAAEELYGARVRVVSDGSELQVMLHVPAGAVGCLDGDRELPARRLAGEPNIVAVDWNAALSDAGLAPRA